MYNRPSRDPEEVRLEILRRAEDRRRKAKREEFGASVMEAVFYILASVLYCYILKLFIKQ
jgi:hypothetical protein